MIFPLLLLIALLFLSFNADAFSLKQEFRNAKKHVQQETRNFAHHVKQETNNAVHHVKQEARNLGDLLVKQIEKVEISVNQDGESDVTVSGKHGSVSASQVKKTFDL